VGRPSAGSQALAVPQLWLGATVVVLQDPVEDQVVAHSKNTSALDETSLMP
jgi:hypothetical protein